MKNETWLKVRRLCAAGGAYTKPKGGVKSIRIWILN